MGRPFEPDLDHTSEGKWSHLKKIRCTSWKLRCGFFYARPFWNPSGIRSMIFVSPDWFNGYCGTNLVPFLEIFPCGHHKNYFWPPASRRGQIAKARQAAMPFCEPIESYGILAPRLVVALEKITD